MENAIAVYTSELEFLRLRATGPADALTTHAEAALTHAKAAEKEKANSHTAEGIKHLEQAIDEGKKGHADAGNQCDDSIVCRWRPLSPTGC